MCGNVHLDARAVAVAFSHLQVLLGVKATKHVAVVVLMVESHLVEVVESSFRRLKYKLDVKSECTAASEECERSSRLVHNDACWNAIHRLLSK